MKSLMRRVEELRRVISTIESTIAKLRVMHASGEVNEKRFKRDLKALNLGLKSLREELETTLTNLYSLADRRCRFEEAFHFYRDIGKPLNLSAFSLNDLREKLAMLPIDSLEFHFHRGDFTAWIRDVIEDPELAKEIAEIKAKGESLRRKLIQLISERIKTYKEESNRLSEPSPQEGVNHEK